MRDDRLTGYATENVAPLTPPDLELLGSLTRQLPRVDAEERARAVWDALEADPAFVEGMAQAEADFEAGRVAPFRHSELTCPIRDCPGHEGPHGSLFGARLDECE